MPLEAVETLDGKERSRRPFLTAPRSGGDPAGKIFHLRLVPGFAGTMRLFNGSFGLAVVKDGGQKFRRASRGSVP